MKGVEEFVVDFINIKILVMIQNCIDEFLNRKFGNILLIINCGFFMKEIIFVLIEEVIIVVVVFIVR